MNDTEKLIDDIKAEDPAETNEDSLEISSNQDETDSYRQPDSVKSDEMDDEPMDDEPMDDEPMDDEPMDDEQEDQITMNHDEEEDEGDEEEDGEDDPQGVLDDMEGTVIHFLAEKSISKTKVKSGIKSACRFKCDNCTSIFRYKSTLNYHLKSECGRKVIKGKALVEKQPQGKVSCNICGKTLCSRTSLMVHMRIHTGERPFVCPECGRSFFQKAHLVDHQNKMHTASCVLCRLCNATFEDKYHLTLHMKEHKQIVTPFNCKLCEESFSTRASLSNHIAGRHSGDTEAKTKAGIRPRSRHPIDPDQTECPDCGRSYSGPRQLRAHVRRAHRASLPCPHCPRLFPSGYDLRVHTRCHTGERPYSCEFCDRTFSRKSILDVHRTLHTGQKDFVCSICSKAFNRKSKLQVHFTEHTRQTVKCEICQKEFKCQSYLSSHMKIHDDNSSDTKQSQKKRKRAVPALTPLRTLRKRAVKAEPKEADSPEPGVSPTSPLTETEQDSADNVTRVVTPDGSQTDDSKPESPIVQSTEEPEIIQIVPDIKCEIESDDDGELPLDCSVKSH